MKKGIPRRPRSDRDRDHGLEILVDAFLARHDRGERFQVTVHPSDGGRMTFAESNWGHLALAAKETADRDRRGASLSVGVVAWRFDGSGEPEGPSRLSLAAFEVVDGAISAYGADWLRRASGSDPDIGLPVEPEPSTTFVEGLEMLPGIGHALASGTPW